MKINKYLQADDTLSAALYTLIEECERRDGFKTAIDLDSSLNAVREMPCVYAYEEGGLKALISVFAPMRDEIEVSALVHPGLRGKGVFRELLKETLAEYSRFGYDKGLFVCASEAGRRVMEHWGLGIDHVELQMSHDITESSGAEEQTELEIRKAQESDVDDLAIIGAAAFCMDSDTEKDFISKALSVQNRTQYIAVNDGRAAGMCAASESGGSIMIYGLGVHPDERRKGIAQAMLRHIAKEAAGRGLLRLGLDVDEDNPAAIALYKSFGFEYDGRTEYYNFEFDAFM